MKPVSGTLSSMARSGIRAVYDRAAQIDGCIRLEVGEPNFNTPDHVIDAAARAARDGYTKYTDNAGFVELRELLAQRHTLRTGAEAGPENVVVTPGAIGALYSALVAIVNPGDEVVICDPCWPNYEMMVHLVDAVPVRVPTTEATRHVPTTVQLDRLVGARTKAIMLNSPANPTGATFEADDFAELVGFARDHDLYVLADEVYDEIVFDRPHVSAASFDGDGRVMTFNSFSKTYAMTGWRIGSVVADANIAALIRKCQEPTTSCVNAPAQMAAIAALAGPQDCVATMREAYRERRDDVVDVLRQAGVPAFVPGGAFYVWIDISRSQQTDLEFAIDLVENHGVAVVPGTAFGPRNVDRVRVSLAAAPDLLHEGVSRLVGLLNRPRVRSD